MRTTIRIDDDLYRAVKERAARSGRTVASVLEDAVRLGLSHRVDTPRAPYRVRATGRDGTLPGVDLSSNSAVQESLDAGMPLDALR
jgi:plasmid stability protein